MKTRVFQAIFGLALGISLSQSVNAKWMASNLPTERFFDFAVDGNIIGAPRLFVGRCNAWRIACE